MNARPAARFLRSLGQVLSTMRLYGEDHPALRRAGDQAFGHLRELLARDPDPVFNFLRSEVVYRDQRIRGLSGWDWGRSLARADRGRLELSAGVSREEFGRFVSDLHRVLEAADASAGDAGANGTDASGTGANGTGAAGATPHAAEARNGATPSASADGAEFPHIRSGKLTFGDVDRKEDEEDAPGERVTSFGEEIEAFSWVLREAREKGKISAAVAGAVVESVGEAIRGSRRLLDLLVPLKDTDQYSTVHSMNVSVLGMAMAEAFGYTGTDVRAIGEASLLHDVGKTKVAPEILSKPAALTPREWDEIKRHPAEGARIILASDDRMDLAAIVAYEHHMTWDGGGYPKRRYSRTPNPASQLIQICDIYDALRTRRPFRQPWPKSKIMSHIREGAGRKFDPKVVETFTRMLARWGELEDTGGARGAGGT